MTVKKRYPLRMTMELVERLLDATTYTKMDIRNTYGNLRVAKRDQVKQVFICQAAQFAPVKIIFGLTGTQGYLHYFTLHKKTHCYPWYHNSHRIFFFRKFTSCEKKWSKYTTGPTRSLCVSVYSTNSLKSWDALFSVFPIRKYLTPEYCNM